MERCIAIAELVLKNIQALIWPIVIVVLLLMYRDAILGLLKASILKFSVFGVEIETNISELERTLTASLSGELTPQQWALLEEIWQKGQVSVQKSNM